MMTDEIYRVPWARWFFRAMGTIPVPEHGVRLSSMKAGIAALERAELLVVFPEGRISPDGQLKRGFPGIVSIAARTGALIVPVYIEGTYRALPRHARFIRLSKITVRFGEPIDVAPDAREPDRRALRRWTETIMDAIRALRVGGR